MSVRIRFNLLTQAHVHGFITTKLSYAHKHSIKMTKILSPRESGEFIVEKAAHLKVKPLGIDALKDEILKGIKEETLSIKNFSQCVHHPDSGKDWAANWIFVVDTLNFCFWSPQTDSKWTVKGNTGYFALCAALNRAMTEDDIDITNPEYYSKISLEELKHIFRSDSGDKFPHLLNERVTCLHEVGKKLIEKYNGNFRNCIKASNKSAEKLLQLIIEEFPCFRDEADYEGRKVSFYKRAQILIGDIWTCYHGEGLGEFHDIGRTITMFADYRIPQVLVHFGALEYSKELMDLLKKDEILENGNPMEVEIRGASIYIVEKVKDDLRRKLQQEPKLLEDYNIKIEHVNSILIDQFLWDYRRRFAAQLEYIPFHKVKSIYY